MNKKVSPWLRFLHWFCPPSLYEGIEGDLLEQFEEDVRVAGEKKAKWRLGWNVIRFFRPGIVLRNSFSTGLINTVMLRNHFVIAWRFMKRNTGYTGINVFGLAIGIASALLILSIIKFELSFDTFHTNADRIYRVVRVSEADGQTTFDARVAGPLPDALENQVPGLEKITSILYSPHLGRQVDVVSQTGVSEKRFKEDGGFVFVQPSFFKVFNFAGTGFRWIEGNPDTALDAPNSLVLTRSAAEKYFPEVDPLGKALQLGNGWGNWQVTGVVEDIPKNSDFPFQVFLSYSAIKGLFENSFLNWEIISDSQCYLTLPASMSREDMEERIEEIHVTHVSEFIAASTKYKLQPLSEIHTDARFGNYSDRTVSSDTLTTLGAIGLFLLIVACINYINLATAQYFQRSKEVGIRKVLGSQRKWLLSQFLTESFMIALVAGLMGLLVAQLAVSYLSDLLGLGQINNVISDFFTWGALLVIVVFVTFWAGFYPAYIISGYKPIEAIRGKLSSGRKGFTLRQVLVAFQFTSTQVFVIAAFVVFRQVEYFQSADLGFNSQSVLNVSIPFGEEDQRLFAEELERVASVERLSFSIGLPVGGGTNFKISRPGWNSSLGVENRWADSSYLGLYEMRLVAGRNFLPSDSLKGFIVNETLCSKLDFTSPEDAVGEPIVVNERHCTIVGVVQDFNSRSLHEKVGSVALSQRHDNRYRMINIKLSSGTKSVEDLSVALEEIEKAWSEVYPDLVFDYRFLDESLKSYYLEELRLSKLFKIFAIVFLFISCLGLYGLVSFVVQKKMKEVAIRKVFGAGLANILILISRDYIKMLGIAFLVAAPTAYYFMQNWLNNFAYHMEISWWILVAPGLMVLLIAMLTVSGKSLKAAAINPANVLKDE